MIKPAVAPAHNNIQPTCLADTNMGPSAKPVAMVLETAKDEASNTAVSALTEPFQQKDFNFSIQVFCDIGFFKTIQRWKWLHYVKEADKALCFTWSKEAN